MNSLIIDDAGAAPDLFLWNGPVDRDQLVEWIERHDWVIPPDLVEFWTRTGGGEILESERFLRPLISTQAEDEVALVTAWCQGRGMLAGLVVFHEGLGFTAVRCVDGAYLSLDSNVRVTNEFSNLDRWYAAVVRAEYAARYGLPLSLGDSR